MCAFPSQRTRPSSLKVENSTHESLPHARVGDGDSTLLTAAVASSVSVALLGLVAVVLVRRHRKAPLSQKVSTQKTASAVRAESDLISTVRLTRPCQYFLILTTFASKTTQGMTKTSDASDTKSFAVAVPGYLALNETDFKTLDLVEVGTGASAKIYRGVLGENMKKRFAFTDVAVKIFAENVDTTAINFELSLMA